MDTKSKETLEKLSLQEVKIKQRKKLVKEQSRKKRTRELIALGAIIVMIGLGHLNINTMLGALIREVLPKIQDEAAIKIWTDIGANELARRSRKEHKKPKILVTFEREPERQAKLLLRHMKIYWDQWHNDWYGYADPQEAKEKLEPFGARIKVVS